MPVTFHVASPQPVVRSSVTIEGFIASGDMVVALRLGLWLLYRKDIAITASFSNPADSNSRAFWKETHTLLPEASGPGSSCSTYKHGPTHIDKGCLQVTYKQQQFFLHLFL